MVTLVIKMVFELVLFAMLIALIVLDFASWRIGDSAVGWALFIWILVVFMANTNSILMRDWRY